MIILFAATRLMPREPAFVESRKNCTVERDQSIMYLSIRVSLTQDGQ